MRSLAFLGRVVALLAVVLVCACGATQPRHGLLVRDVRFPLRTMTFPSGLRVVVEEDHAAPVVGVFTVVGVGSTGDPPGKEGLAHYVEHLAFRARPDGKSSVRHLLAQSGVGIWNAFTGLDDTGYFSVGPSSALAAMLRVEGERLLAPVANVDAPVAAVELDVVRNEILQRNETGTIGQILAWMQDAVFPDAHPYNRPIGGTLESLSGVTIADAEAFAKRHYRPDNMTMVVVGDVDLRTVHQVVEASLPEALRAGPGKKPAPRLPPAAPEPPVAPKGPLAEYRAAVATPEVWIGWSLPRSFDASTHLARFVRSVAVAQIAAAWSEDEDIAEIGTLLVQGNQASMLLVKVALHRGSHPARSAEHALDQLHRIWTSSGDPRLYEARFRQGVRAAVTGMLFEAENITRRGMERAELTHFTGDATTYTRQLRSLVQLDASSVSDFAYKYLSRERARFIVVRPQGSGEAAPSWPAGVAATPLDPEESEAPDPATLRSLLKPQRWGARLETLPNGMEVVIAQRPGLPVVTAGLLLHGGAASAEPLGVAELAVDVAHPRRRWKGDPGDFGARLQRSGDKDDVRYVIRGSSGNLGDMLAVLSEQAQAMSAPSSLRNFHQYFVPYLKTAEQKPEVQADRAFWSALYGTHPYGRAITAADLEKLDTGDIDRWIDATHAPGNAVLAIVGDIDPDAVLAEARQHFGGWSGSAGAQAPPAEPRLPPADAARRPTFVVHIRPGASQAQIRIGCLLPPARSAPSAPHDLAAALAEARLTNRMRHQMGVTYGFHGDVEVLRGAAAHLDIQGSVATERLADALSVVRDALASLAEGSFEPGELDAARWSLARRHAVGHLGSGAVVSTLLDLRSVGQQPGALEAYPLALGRTKAEDLQAMLAQCVHGRLVIAVLGDEAAVPAALAKVWP